jgi:C-terminal processing protease CtpA/Prc
VPSWRTNIAKRLEKTGNLPRVEELSTLTHERFTANRPLRQYALARTFFLYLHDSSVLKTWYAQYGQAHAEDPLGLESLSRATGKSLDEIHADYRAWVRALPMVAETGEDLTATLGVQLDPGGGDGPRVMGFVEPGVRRSTGLRLGDVITSINGQSTRDLQEFIRVLARSAAGETVQLTYRRGRLHGASEVVLRARE